MLLTGQINSFNEIVSVGNSSFTITPGVSITAGTSSANGSWTAWATPTNDVYGIYLSINSSFTTAVARNHTIDIGIDPAGGTSYTVLLQDLQAGYQSTSVALSRENYFPLFIKGGSSIAIRSRCSNASSRTLNVYGKLYCKPSNPAVVWAGTRTETIGYAGSTVGTSVTPGTNAIGSWVSLGTTARALKYWQLSVSTDSSAYNGINVIFTELAYGRRTNYRQIMKDHRWTTISTSELGDQLLYPSPGCWCDVPAGSTIYARCASRAVATLNSPVSVLAVGVGN